MPTHDTCSLPAQAETVLIRLIPTSLGQRRYAENAWTEHTLPANGPPAKLANPAWNQPHTAMGLRVTTDRPTETPEHGDGGDPRPFWNAKLGASKKHSPARRGVMRTTARSTQNRSEQKNALPVDFEAVDYACEVIRQLGLGRQRERRPAGNTPFTGFDVTDCDSRRRKSSSSCESRQRPQEWPLNGKPTSQPRAAFSYKPKSRYLGNRLARRGYPIATSPTLTTFVPMRKPGTIEISTPQIETGANESE